MRENPGPDVAGPAPAPGDVAGDLGHPPWCQFERPGALGGVEHLSGVFEWHPTYMPDVAVSGRLRRVSYPDGSEETPVVVLQVDNPERPGEIGLSAEDLASLAESLLRLNRTLLA